MKKILLILPALIGIYTAHAQPSIQWQKCLGGTSDDYGYSIWKTTDGGYITSGFTESNNGDVTANHGYKDYWVVKTDNAGSIQWQKCLGGICDDEASSVQQTSDGGYIVAGDSYSSDGDVTGHHLRADYWIVKLDNAGSIQWQKALGGTYNDIPSSIQQTADGGYIVTGFSMSSDGDVTGHHADSSTTDIWVVKLDGSGSMQWQKSLGGTSFEYASSVKQTTDGGYIVSGVSSSIDGDITGHHGTTQYYDYWIVKLNSSGAIQWQKSLGGTGLDYANSIQQTNDGGYIVAGFSSSYDGDITGNHGGSDYWIAKLDNAGSIQWQKSLGGTNGEVATSIQQTSDGGYIVAGNTVSNNGDVTGYHGGYIYGDYWIVKLSSSGNLQWQKSLGGTDDDQAFDILQTTDGGFIVAGLTLSSDGDVTGLHGFLNDFWLVKLTAYVGVEAYSSSILQIYPSPVKNTFTIYNAPFTIKNIEIYNALGQPVLKSEIQNPSSEIPVDVSMLTAGMYFIKADTDKGRWEGNFVKE